MVNWSCVYKVKDYGGSFEEAQKAARSGGGGVVYLPSGQYSFSANIRGEPTTEMAKKGTSPGSLAPKTVSSNAHLVNILGYSTLIQKVKTLGLSMWS